MPSSESSVMDKRLRFVARLLEGEQMALLCREFGISRKIGYKLFDRYKEHGLEALTDRSRRPVRCANQLPQEVEAAIVNLKREKPHWGRPQNPRTDAAPPGWRDQGSRHKHHPCGDGPSRSG